MLNTRASGVLMHLSSIPSRYGIGVMGDETKRFIDKIKDMGFSYWQVLPLNPPDFYGSPYTSDAVFAISHMFISPDGLVRSGLVSAEDTERSVYYGSPYTADYEFAYSSRLELLRKAYENAGKELRQRSKNSFRKTNGAGAIPFLWRQRRSSKTSRGMSGIRSLPIMKIALKMPRSLKTRRIFMRLCSTLPFHSGVK